MGNSDGGTGFNSPGPLKLSLINENWRAAGRGQSRLSDFLHIAQLLYRPYPSPMPTIFRQDGFHAFFYSNQGDPREPSYVHVIAGAAEATFWLRPDVTLATSAGFDARMLRRATLIIEARRDVFERAWHDYFGGKPAL